MWGKFIYLYLLLPAEERRKDLFQLPWGVVKQEDQSGIEQKKSLQIVTVRCVWSEEIIIRYQKIIITSVNLKKKRVWCDLWMCMWCVFCMWGVSRPLTSVKSLWVIKLTIEWHLALYHNKILSQKQVIIILSVYWYENKFF